MTNPLEITPKWCYRSIFLVPAAPAGTSEFQDQSRTPILDLRRGMLLRESRLWRLANRDQLRLPAFTSLTAVRAGPLTGLMIFGDPAIRGAECYLRPIGKRRHSKHG